MAAITPVTKAMPQASPLSWSPRDWASCLRLDGRVGDRPGDRGEDDDEADAHDGDEDDAGVAVADVGDLVGDDAFQLATVGRLRGARW